MHTCFIWLPSRLNSDRDVRDPNSDVSHLICSRLLGNGRWIVDREYLPGFNASWWKAWHRKTFSVTDLGYIFSQSVATHIGETLLVSYFALSFHFVLIFRPQNSHFVRWASRAPLYDVCEVLYFILILAIHNIYVYIHIYIVRGIIRRSNMFYAAIQSRFCTA